MIRKTLFLLAALLFLDFSAHAQVGVYATVSVYRIGETPFASYNINGPVVKSSVDPVGATFGAYYDLKTYGPVRLGVDLRGNVLTSDQGASAFAKGSGTRLYSALGGVRGTFHTPYSALKPYAQLSAGLGRSDFGYLQNSVGAVVLANALEYHAFAGVDLRLLPQLDLRAIELGYGGLDGGGAPKNFPLRSLSTGLVFRFP